MHQTNIEKMDYNFNSALVLGCGGSRPRVSTYKMQHSKIQTYMTLPRDHSVYAIDVNRENKQVAIGTKGGSGFILEEIPIVSNDTHATYLQIYQGAPILSICWINDALLAISDSAGRCRIWNINHPVSPWELKTNKEVIFSLILMKDGKLVGLSKTGKIYTWNVFEPYPISICDVHQPPSMGAFVRIINWHKRGCIAFSGQGGHLIFFDTQTEKIEVIQAHEGDFYGIASLTKRLFTVGMKDGLLKIWEPSSNTPAHSFPAQKDILSIDVIKTDETHLLLVDAAGALNTYSFEGSNAKLLNRLTGQDIRIVCPSYQCLELDAESGQAVREEIRQIADDLTNFTAQMSREEKETYHVRLTELGYEHIWHEIWIKHALQQNDIVQALQYSIPLMEKIPKNEISVTPLMERYAQLLEMTWHCIESQEVCKAIDSLNPNYEFELNTMLLEKNITLIQTENCIIDLTNSSVTMEQIIASYTILEKPFSGRYMVKKLDPEICKECRLSPDDILKKYRMVSKENGNNKLPPADLKKAWVLNNTDPEHLDLITFGNGKINEMPGIQFAVGISSSETDTIILPCIIFDWDKSDNASDNSRANQEAEKQYTAFWNNELVNASIARTHKALNQALRRLINESR